MEIELTRPEIEVILCKWARAHGYKVESACVRSCFSDGSYDICLLKGSIQVEPPEKLLDKKEEWENSLEGDGTKYAPLLSTIKWKVEYSLQDEGPRQYDEEFDTEGDARAFVEMKEAENPLPGTIMHHLISPEGHIGY